ncbi:GntR family transcriptional regulator [Roseburia sp. BX1005]|uniref:GntR family transcriptional regulator n=1 Tax=Roseburia zhanii TaxID=2763064 RepID=A0A923RS70_9FIRM|nr:GntR family transcriptional regulator [Roseburia zhanii]MBC5713317.1 GntR family transcriptional regulator [Roseburia zhanii]OLA80302.1 MAG: GntR family transcriptional regulator [Roseburia sp. 40_7]
MPWNLTSDRPIFMQIIEIIQLEIISGKYRPGDKLPSVRDLASEAAVNPNTMQKALSELERSGLVYSQRTSGRFITEDVKMIEELKSSLAKEKIHEFLENMQKLGFQKEETIRLMTETLKGEEL